MLSIDGTIAHARAIAKYKRKKLDECIKKNIYACKFCNEIRTCKEVAEEHEQLAEWLEELKTYRQYIDLTEIPEQYKLGFQDGFIDGYNKGIDDFVKFANTMPTVELEDGTIRPMWLEEMAEQLKKGER